MSNQTKTIATHTSPDPDAIAAIWLLVRYLGLKLKNVSFWFMEGQNTELTTLIHNMVSVDRGFGPMDHHSWGLGQQTSTSLVAKELKIKDIFVNLLMKLVADSDLRGISPSFSLAYILKCVQRNKDMNDEEKVILGLRVISALESFCKNDVNRNNARVNSLIKSLLPIGIIPKQISDYQNQLKNPRFVRDLDFVEIILGEESLNNKKQAEDLAAILIKIVYKDSILYYEAQSQLNTAIKAMMKEHLIIAQTTDNTKFNTAARSENASIAIQRQTNGSTQIYFNNQKNIEDSMIGCLVSVIRLEELLTQNRPIPPKDLRALGTIKEIPEWYFFKAENGPGRFILNGSLTTPDIPPSRISLETLVFLTGLVIKFWPKFNWVKWQEERVAYYKNK